MPVIVDRGGPSDNAALKLETRKRRWIHNEQVPERSPDEMRDAVAFALAGRRDVVLRTAASHYNCMGLIFGARRTSIDIDRWDLVRSDDGYRQLHPGEAPVIGDLVLYRRDGVPRHVGIVVEVRLSLNGVPAIMVLSQWGFDGEYRHPIAQVPALYGAPTEIWTDRKRHA